MVMNSSQKFIDTVSSWGYHLSEQQQNQFSVYKEELISWNNKLNLTRITEDRGIYIQHFLDSLMLLKFVHIKPQDTILDIGTGAGFPGVPIKITLPAMHVDLLESKFKKTRFLNRIVGKLSLDNVTVYNDRAEELAHDDFTRESYSIVVTRAVSSLSTIAELGLPFLTVSGKLYVWKTNRQFLEERDKAKRALELLNGEITSVWEYFLPGNETLYVLVELSKTAPTEERYPRNVGIPDKRPL